MVCFYAKNAQYPNRLKGRSPQVTRERVLEEGICLFQHLWCLLTALTIPQEGSISSVIVELQRDIVILRAFLE